MSEHTTPQLIGLTGHAGVGKDSVGALLQAAGWARSSFAQALRVEVAEHWRIDPRLLDDRWDKERPIPAMAVGAVHHADWLRWATFQGHNLITPRSPRWVLQQWGSYRRCQHPDYWIQHVRVWHGTVGHKDPRASSVITDVRYANEAAALRALGGLIVRVHRPHGAAALGPDTAHHESEQHTQIQADADLVNDGTVYDLAVEVRRVVHQLSTPNHRTIA